MNNWNHRLGGVAISWVALHLVGWMIYVNGYNGPSNIVCRFIKSIWTVELYILAWSLGLIAMIFALDLWPTGDVNPAEIAIPPTLTIKPAHTGPKIEPAPVIQNPKPSLPKPTASDLKKEALRQILEAGGENENTSKRS